MRRKITGEGFCIYKGHSHQTRTFGVVKAENCNALHLVSQLFNAYKALLQKNVCTDEPSASVCDCVNRFLYNTATVYAWIRCFTR